MEARINPGPLALTKAVPLELFSHLGVPPRIVRWRGLLARHASMNKSQQYRRFAQECLELAQSIEDQQSRFMLLEMARVWFRLAEEYDIKSRD